LLKKKARPRKKELRNLLLRRKSLNRLVLRLLLIKKLPRKLQLKMLKPNNKPKLKLNLKNNTSLLNYLYLFNKLNSPPKKLKLLRSPRLPSLKR
jgi:hypothetical protein